MENNEEIKDDIVSFKEIDAVGASKGGKKIIKGLREDIINVTDTLARDYKTTTHMELVALCADLSAKLAVYRVLTNAKKNIEALEDILKLEE
jgi:hypothetical protein